MHTWKLGTINIRSGKEKEGGWRMFSVAKEIDKLGIIVCGIQEVRHRNVGKQVISLPNGNKYAFLWCGKKKRRDAGVGFLIRIDPRIKFDEIETSNPRVISISVNIYGFKAQIVNAYAPTNIDGTANQKNEFYRLVKKACIPKSKKHKLILVGDFNAETALSEKMCQFNYESVIADEKCNENGERLKDLCRSQRLYMIQTYFEYPLEKRYTWYSNDGKTKKILDFTLVQSFTQQFVDDCQVIQENIFNSDHRLVQTALTTPMTKKARFKKRNCTKKPIDIKSLRGVEVQTEYTNAVRDKFSSCNDETVNDISCNIVQTLNKIADQVIPRKNKQALKEMWKEDEIFNDLLDQRSSTSDPNLNKMLTKNIKKRVRYLKNLLMKEEADKIDEKNEKRDIEGLYRSFKNQSTAFKPLKTQSSCDPDKLKEHFKRHFDSTKNNLIPKELHEVPGFIRNLTIDKELEIVRTPPTKKEIQETLQKLKLYKSSNDIPLAFLRYACDCEIVITEMVKLYTKVWENEEIPRDWSHSKLVTLWKGSEKGKVTDPEAYRGIQVGSAMCKVLVCIILSRISLWYNSQLTDQQQGFRAGKGTTDGIFLVKKVQQISRSSRKKVFALFVDLSAAFDHVNRIWMFKSIYQRLPNKRNRKLFILLEKIYKLTTTALANDPNGIFETKTGVRQGGPESPALYNLYMDYVMRVFTNECRKFGIKFFKSPYRIPGKATNPSKEFGLGSYGEVTVDWIGYADDLVLFFEDESSLNKGFEILNSTFERYELEINYEKTKTMIFNYEGNDYPKTIIKTENGKGKGIIKNVLVFRYLGCQIHSLQEKTGDEELNVRVDSATARFYALSNKFFNHKIALKTRVKILNSLVRTRLTYGCSTWCLTVQQQKRMDSEYTCLLRKMVRGGYKRKPDSYSYVYTNEKLHDMCNTTPLHLFIKKQQRSYLAHLIRQEDTTIAKRLLFEAEMNRVPGRVITLRKRVAENEQCDEETIIERAMNRNI